MADDLTKSTAGEPTVPATAPATATVTSAVAEPTTATTPPETASSPVPAAAALPSTDENTVVQGLVQVDDDRDDDPGFGDGASDVSGSFVSSLNSSIMDYKYQNGRRYHAFREGAYLVPNDDTEQERMDLVHHLCLMLLEGELHLAPISKSPQRVLDLGTGTGIWAMDFADQYPSAEVLGVDLSPIQPKWTPPNCSFEVDDFEQAWAYRRKFDYIHGRELGGCISDPDQLFRRAYENLQPGGYFEIQAVLTKFVSDDGTDANAKDAHYWMDNINAGAAKFGKPLDVAPTWFEKVKAAGFADVQQHIRKLPIGGWPKDPTLKDIGRYQLIQELQAVDSYTPGIFANVLGWKKEEIDVLVAKVKRDIKNPAIHLYFPVYIVYGRKP